MVSAHTGFRYIVIYKYCFFWNLNHVLQISMEFIHYKYLNENIQRTSSTGHFLDPQIITCITGVYHPDQWPSNLFFQSLTGGKRPVCICFYVQAQTVKYVIRLLPCRLRTNPLEQFTTAESKMNLHLRRGKWQCWCEGLVSSKRSWDGWDCQLGSQGNPVKKLNTINEESEVVLTPG